MDTGFARSGVSSEGNEGTVGNVEKNTVMRTDQVAEERDLVGVYLHEISRTPLLDAAKEVDLSKAIEAGLYAEHLLGEDRVPAGVDREDLERLVVEGERAKDLFIRANLRLVVSIARRYVRSGMPMFLSTIATVPSLAPVARFLAIPTFISPPRNLRCARRC